MTKVIKIARGTTRKVRRASGNFKPVNTAASIQQAPEGKYAKSVGKGK